jgi:DNA gyrase subunit A
LEKIAELVNDKKLDGISDLRDESNREGIRVVCSPGPSPSYHMYI